MVQELHVLKCFSCETFQSHIVKKTNKWECKVCGTKQSIKKVYGRGSGKDCRIHTQKLNSLKGEKEDQKYVFEEDDDVEDQSVNIFPEELAQNETPMHPVKSNKWEEFLDECKTTEQKHSCVIEEVPVSHNQLKNGYGKRKRKNFLSSDSGANEDCFKESESHDSVDDIYSDFSFCNTQRCFKPNKISTYQTKVYKKEENLEHKSLIGSELRNKYPAEKFRKLESKKIPTKVSLKWSKYLEPEHDNVTHPKYNSGELCENVSLDQNNEVLESACSIRDCKLKITERGCKDITNAQPIKLPVFDQLSELNDSDFQLDF